MSFMLLVSASHECKYGDDVSKLTLDELKQDGNDNLFKTIGYTTSSYTALLAHLLVVAALWICPFFFCVEFDRWASFDM
jgi:hypothetical protein